MVFYYWHSVNDTLSSQLATQSTRAHIIHCTQAFGQFVDLWLIFSHITTLCCERVFVHYNSFNGNERQIRESCNWIKWVWVCGHEVENFNCMRFFPHECVLFYHLTIFIFNLCFFNGTICNCLFLTFFLVRLFSVNEK